MSQLFDQVDKILELQLQSFQWIFRVDFLWNWLVWSPCSPTDSQSLLQHHSSKASIPWHLAFFMVQLSHPYKNAGKTIAMTIRTFVGKVMPLLFNMLSRFVIAFLPRSKSLLISWLQLPSTVIMEPKKRKYVTVSTYPPYIYYEVMGLNAMISAFWMLSFKPVVSLSLSSRGSLAPLHFLPLDFYQLHIWGCWYFSQQSWFQLCFIQSGISNDILCI